MSPDIISSILAYKKQKDQDNLDRAAEAQSNLPDTRPRTTGTYGPLANAVSNNIQGSDQVPITPMSNPPVAGGVAKDVSRLYPQPGYGSVNDQPDSEIQQYPDLPTSPQLDRSNLAGPVPTNLTPPPGYGQRPRLATGVPVEEGAAPPIGYNGGQLINAQDRAYLNPRVPDPNLTYEGRARPQLQTYEGGTNVEGRHISRGSRFGAGFREGVRGGLIDGLIGGFAGVVAPGFGNNAAYERDLGRFDAEKTADQSQDAHDPYYQNQLQSQQLRMDQPVKLQTFQAQQAYEKQRQIDLANVNNAARLQQIGARGTNTIDAIQARAQYKANADINAARALYSGMLDPDTGKPFTAQQVDQMARDDISDVKNAKLDKLWAQADQATATTDLRKAQKDTAVATTGLRNAQTVATQKLGDLRDKQGNLIQNKIDNPQQYYRGMTGDALYRAQVGDFNDTLKQLDKEEQQLHEDRRAGTIKQPEFDTKLTLIQEKRTAAQQAKSEAARQIIGQDAARTQSGKTKAPAAGPTLSTGHKAGDTVTVGGKQVRITKVHPDGKTFDYEAIK